jgi:hypothetical protein
MNAPDKHQQEVNRLLRQIADLKQTIARMQVVMAANGVVLLEKPASFPNAEQINQLILAVRRVYPSLVDNDGGFVDRFTNSFLATTFMRRLDKPDANLGIGIFSDASIRFLQRNAWPSEMNSRSLLAASIAHHDIRFSDPVENVNNYSPSLGLTIYHTGYAYSGQWKRALCIN